ncbi:MAG: response regulator transcription factor [Hyphomonadaceae bacterium]|nr:response regulator transcription factor [Hyphomonadaceae bacterium]
MTLRVLIADDEPLALRRITIALERAPDVEVVGTAKNGVEAVAMIRQLKPDVVLLDIDMPHLDGMAVAEAIAGANAPSIIFITAHESFALPAFDRGAVDYLLKPLDEDRLHRALERSRGAVGARGAQGRIAELKALVAALRARTKPDQADEDFWVSRRQELIRVRLADVLWISVDGDYAILHTKDGAFLVHESLRSIEARLDPAVFLRVHRSAIVRRSAIEAVERMPMGGLQLRLALGAVVRVSKPYRRAVSDYAKGSAEGERADAGLDDDR